MRQAKESTEAPLQRTQAPEDTNGHPKGFVHVTKHLDATYRSDTDKLPRDLSEGAIDALHQRIQGKIATGLLQSSLDWFIRAFPVITGTIILIVWLNSLAPRSHVDNQKLDIEAKIVKMQQEIQARQKEMRDEIKQLFDEKFSAAWREIGRMETRIEKIQDQILRYAPKKEK